MRNNAQKIAIYLPSLRGGGAERVMVNLANGFAARCIKTDLVLAKAEGPYLDSVSSQVQIVDLESSRVIISLPGLIRYLRESRPDVLLATMGHANVIAIWARWLSGMEDKIRLVVREAVTISINSKHTRHCHGKFLPLLTRKFYPRADAIVANSLNSAKDLNISARIPLSCIKVIYNPIDTEAIRKAGQKFPDHSWYQKTGLSIIVAVGRLTEQKDFTTLIQAFQKICTKNQRLRLMILGEGEKRAELEQLICQLGISDKVALPGFVNNPYTFLKHADLFVLSSRWEGLPNALLEALAVGTPVVSTDCPSGPSEILENGKYGRLVPVGDAETMAEAMVETLVNPLDSEMLKKRAEDFSVDKIVEQYLTLLIKK